MPILIMTNFEKTVRLYKKFIEGTRWINAKKLRGDNVEKWEKKFKNEVNDPLEEVWSKLNEFESKNMCKISKMITLFTGTIELEETKAHFINKQSNMTDKEEGDAFCPRCKTPGTRYCFGDTGNGKYDYGMFCLKCEPYNE